MNVLSNGFVSDGMMSVLEEICEHFKYIEKKETFVPQINLILQMGIKN